MYIKPKDPEQCEVVLLALQSELKLSRFTAVTRIGHHPRWKRHVFVENVRKRRSAPYCGQHPNECQANPFFKRPERKGTWLEGADWVGFNDGLNDILDRLEMDADVWSFNREADGSRYFIRKGLERRIAYDSNAVFRYGRVFYHWVAEGTFENCIGAEAPRSRFPSGTPGLAEWYTVNLCTVCQGAYATTSKRGPFLCESCAERYCSGCHRPDCSLHEPEDLCWRCTCAARKFAKRKDNTDDQRTTAGAPALASGGVPAGA